VVCVAPHSDVITSMEMSMTKKLPGGLDGRTRDQNPPKAGEIRQKRGNTQVSTLRREYGENFAAGIRSDATLETLRQHQRLDH
jgi:hypothetical protein